MAASKAVISRLRAARTPQRADKSPTASTHNFIERLPCEVLMKILSYLDASALYNLIHVNKFFICLANDNVLWNKIYLSKFSKKKKLTPKCTDDLLLKMATVEVQDQPAGYWKWQFFKAVAACDMKKWRRQLEFINAYTGLPRQTEQALRNLRITWELTVCNESGRRYTLELSWSQFFQTSITVCGSTGGSLPSYQQISTLQLHAVWGIVPNCSGLKKRSLMMTLDMQILNKDAKVIGQDRMIELKLLEPGVIFGIWRGQCSVAFVLFTLHFHRLMERSLQGSPDRPYVEPIFKPPFDDTDPEYGLHGYQLHIVLHNTTCTFMFETFSQLFCRRTEICDGLVQLTAISRTNLSEHTPLIGNISLPWRCEALQGTVENCCIMTLTLLDEFRKPFWCVSSAVSVVQQNASVCFDYDDEHYLIHYRDSDGQVNMELKKAKEGKHLVLVSLIVYLTTHKVNKHFGRDY